MVGMNGEDGTPDPDAVDAVDRRTAVVPAAAGETIERVDALEESPGSEGAQAPSPEDMPFGFVPV